MLVVYGVYRLVLGLRSKTGFSPVNGLSLLYNNFKEYLTLLLNMTTLARQKCVFIYTTSMVESVWMTGRVGISASGKHSHEENKYKEKPVLAKFHLKTKKNIYTLYWCHASY